MNDELPKVSLDRDKVKENAYLKALEEFNSNQQDKGLYTKLFVELNGDEKRVKIAYLEIRAREFFSEAKTVQANTTSESSGRKDDAATAVQIVSTNERLIKYQRLNFCARLMIFWVFLLFGFLFFSVNFSEIFEGTEGYHPLFGLIFGLSFLIPFVISINSIWYLANEAGKFGGLWAISSWIFFPLGFVISYFRIKKIANERGWLT
jgi:hypothetical protein